MEPMKMTPELDEFRAEIRKTAERAFAAKSAYWDKTEEYPHENHKLMGELGYLGLGIPEEYGGSGAPLIKGVLMLEEIARVCYSTAEVAHIYLHAASHHIKTAGTEEQKRRYLPKIATGEYMMSISLSEPHAGSALTDLTTSARVEGDQVVINGAKAYYTCGHVATHALVYVRFGKSTGANGIGAVLIKKGTPGITFGMPHGTMGARAVGDTDIFFDNARIPIEDVFVMGNPENTSGFKKLMRCFGTERVGISTMCIGIAQGALEYAIKYTQDRHQFGRPISEFQGLRWKIADMTTQVHAARLMAYRAAQNTNELGLPDPKEAAMAKLYACEMVQRVTNEAMQLCGHVGYTSDCPLERMYRDGRNFSFAGGTLEMMRNRIASLTYGDDVSQRRN